MSTLAQDHCTDTNGVSLDAHVMDIGSGWTELQGDWSISANTAVLTTAAGDSQNVAVFDAGQADVTFTCDVTYPDNGSWPFSIGIVVNVTDNSNYGLFEFNHVGATNLYEKVAGTFTAPGSGTWTPSTAGGTVTLKVVTAGDNIKCYLNNVLTIDYTGAPRPNKTGTKFGIRAYDGSPYNGRIGVAFDNILVTIPTNAGITDAWLRLSGTASVVNTAANYGTAPYTYQYQRAPDVSGSPGTFANVGSSQGPLGSGVAPNELLDTGLSGVNYWYRVHAVDSLSVAQDSSPVLLSDHYQSVATGAWESATTWGEHSPPVSGTVVTDITHSININSAAACGTSPSNGTTIVLRVSGTKTLLVNPGYSLTIKGNVELTGGATLQVGTTAGGGATLEFDSHSATTPTTTYGCKLGLVDYDLGYLVTRGKVGSRSTVRSNASGGAARFTRGGANTGCVLSRQYTDFVRIGDSSAFGFDPGYAYPQLMDTDNCIFDTCGGDNWRGQGGQLYPEEQWQYTHTSWQNTQTGYCIYQSVGLNAVPTTAVREFSDCVFDKPVQWKTAGLTTHDNIHLDAVGDATPYGLYALFDNNFIRMRISETDIPRLGLWNECAMVCDGSTLDPYLGIYTATADLFNPHWTQADLSGTTIECKYTIFEDFGSTGDGDVDLHNISSGSLSYIHHCIGISQNADDPGTLSTFINSGQSKYEHNTWLTSQVGAVAIGEADPGTAGQLQGFKSNLLFRRSPDSSVFEVGSYSTGSLTTDIAPAGSIDYNCGFNVNLGGVGGGGINIPLTWTPNTHAVNVNPQFVDWNRNFSKWVQSLDSSWSGNPSPTRTDYNARGLHKLRLKNQPWHTDYDTRYTVTAYKSYIRAGFAPQNIALKDAGHDGVTIGAVEWTSGSSGFLATAGIGDGTGARLLTIEHIGVHVTAGITTGTGLGLAPTLHVGGGYLGAAGIHDGVGQGLLTILKFGDRLTTGITAGIGLGLAPSEVRGQIRIAGLSTGVGDRLLASLSLKRNLRKRLTVHTHNPRLVLDDK
jgi:hypothetical protein